MKKKHLRERAEQAERRAEIQEWKVRELQAEIETMRKHWRPVPIAHPWQPRDWQCTLCDEPRDAARHQEQP